MAGLIKKYLVLGLLIVVIASLGINSYLSYTTKALEGEIRVNAKIDFGTSEKNRMIEVKNGTTVLEVLESIADVETKEYTGMGKLVTSIDGVKQDSEHSWLYFVNGELASISVDNYKLSEDSSFTFKYLSSEEALKYFE